MTNRHIYILFIPAIIVVYTVGFFMFRAFSKPIYKALFEKKSEIVIYSPERISTYTIPIRAYKIKPAREHYGNVADTIATISSMDTIYLYPPKSMTGPGIIEVLISADSLSGCTSGYATIEKSSAGLVWYKAAFSDQLLINGAADQELKYHDFIYRHEKVRIKVTANMGTQQTKISAAYAILKN